MADRFEIEVESDAEVILFALALASVIRPELAARAVKLAAKIEGGVALYENYARAIDGVMRDYAQTGRRGTLIVSPNLR